MHNSTRSKESMELAILSNEKILGIMVLIYLRNVFNDIVSYSRRLL